MVQDRYDAEVVTLCVRRKNGAAPGRAQARSGIFTGSQGAAAASRRSDLHFGNMNGQLAGKMTVDQFFVRAEGRPGRFELYDGIVYALAPQPVAHAEAKFAVQTALAAAVRRAGVSCHMLPNGMTVRIDQGTAHEPDALIYCGPELPPDAIEVPEPMIVVEVLSPSTRHVDASAKLAGYFSLSSVQHYLIIDPDKPPVIHHARRADGTLLTRLVSTGPIRLDPPGLELTVAEMFAVP